MSKNKYRVVEYEKRNEYDDYNFCLQRRTRQWFFWHKWLPAYDISDCRFKSQHSAFSALAAHLEKSRPPKILRIWECN